MTTERKVRANFDLTKEYSVDVSKCTEEEKKQVQQAFFDVGLHWANMPPVGEYKYLGALQYSNRYAEGEIAKYLLMAGNPRDCNMTPAEFLELVYEPEQQGHVHAELMVQYAEDAKTHAEPWLLWQFHCAGDVWHGLASNPTWDSGLKYRRKSQTHIVHGVEIPDLRITPEFGERYVSPCPSLPSLASVRIFGRMSRGDAYRAEKNLCYENTEAGRQAAILHAKAMLGVTV